MTLRTRLLLSFLVELNHPHTVLPYLDNAKVVHGHDQRNVKIQQSQDRHNQTKKARMYPSKNRIKRMKERQ